MIAALALAGSLLVGQTHSPSAESVDIRIVRVDRFVAGRLFEAGLAPLMNATRSLTDRQALEALGQAGAATGTAIFSPLRYEPLLGHDTPLHAQAYGSRPGGYTVEVMQEGFLGFPVEFETLAYDARVSVSVTGVEPDPAGGRRSLELGLDLASATRTPEAVAEASLTPAPYAPVCSIDHLRVPDSGVVVWAATPPKTEPTETGDAFLVFVGWSEPEAIAGRLFEVRLAEAPRSLAEDIAGRELVESGSAARFLAGPRATDALRRIESAGGRLAESRLVRLRAGSDAGILFRLKRPIDSAPSDAIAVRLVDVEGAGATDRLGVALSNEWHFWGGLPLMTRSAEIGLSSRLTSVWPVAIPERAGVVAPVVASPSGDECVIGGEPRPSVATARDTNGRVLLVFVTPVAE